MAVEVASAYVSLLPSFRGGARAIQRELSQATGTASQRAGRDAGQRFTGGFGVSFAGGSNRIGNTLLQTTGTASQRAGKDSGRRFGAGFGTSVSRGSRGVGDGIADGTQRASEAAGRESGSRFGRLFASFSMPPLRGLGAAAVGLFAADSILNFFSSAIGEAEEARKVSALTRQVIKSTGGAAHVSAGQVSALSGRLSELTGIDDEVVQSGQNLLLTFTNIRNEAGRGNDIFTQATKTMVDMSAALGQDMKSSSIQLGKALNDPVKGITALQRVGVSFTAGQRDQIKTLATSGRRLQAQKLILAELRKEFGGAAAAQATATDKLKVAWGNFLEEVGTALQPVLDRLAKFLSTTLLPALLRFGRYLSATLGPAIARITAFFRSLRAGAQSTSGGLTGMLARFRELAQSLARQLGPAVGPVLSGLRRIAVEVAPLLQSAGQLLIALFSRLAAVGTWVAQRLGPYAVPLITSAWRIISTLVSTVLRHLTGAFKVMTALLRGDWSAAWRHAKALVASTAGGILQVVRLFFTRYIPAAVRFGVGTIKELWGAGWRWILRTVQNIGSGIWAWAQLAMTRLTLAIGGGIQAAVGFFLGLPLRIIGALAGLGRTLYRAGANALQSLWDGAKAIARRFLEWFRGLAAKIRGLWPFSPAKWGPLRSHPMDRAGRNLMLGLATGIRQSTGTVVGHAQRAAALIGGAAAPRGSYAPPVLSSPATGARRTRNRPAAPVQINVAGVTDPDALAREVMRRTAWATAIA